MEDTFTFPLVRIKDMPEQLRDWLLSRSAATGKSSAAVAVDALLEYAAQRGLPPTPHEPTNPTNEGRAA